MDRLRFALEQIGPAGLDVSEDLPAAELGLEGEIEGRTYEPAGPVGVRVRLERVGDDVLSRGRVTLDVWLPCDRCLEATRVGLAEEVHTVYSRGPHEAGEADLQDYERIKVENAPGKTSVEYVDLTEDLRQRLILAWPMKVVCREECKGLCPDCGANLNKGECSCRESWVDPRLEPLRRLLREEDEGNATPKEKT